MGVDSNCNAVNPVGKIIEKTIRKWIIAHDYNKKLYESKTPVYIKLKKYGSGERNLIKRSKEAKYRKIKEELKDWRKGRCKAFNGFEKVICNEIQQF